MKDVFCSVASFRDPNVVTTCESLIADPGLPLRVVVLLQDSDTGVRAALDRLGVEVVQVEWRVARGAGWARAVIQSFWAGEPWFYMCDAHMDFVAGWAAALAEQSALVPEKSILSSYVHGAHQTIRQAATVMNVRTFDRQGGIRGPAGFREMSVPEKARRVSNHHFWAPGRWCDDVPMDPRIYFGAEEQTLALRSWTHGYDLWHPAVPLARHTYQRDDGRVTHWRANRTTWGALRRESNRRMAIAYGWASGDLGNYGLGRDRTRSEFEAYAGVDFSTTTHATDDEWRQSATAF